MTESNTTEETLPVDAPAPRGRVNLSEGIELCRVTESHFAVLVFERGLAHLARSHWTTRADSLEPVLPYAVATSRTEQDRAALVDLERVVGVPCLVNVILARETIRAQIASAEQPALRAAEEWLRASFEPMRAVDQVAPRVPISFWSYGTYANEVARSIVVPVWSEIARNYPASVRVGLERLFDLSQPATGGGQLVLWHGDPGTGKTYALRALAWAWRAWCDVHYVTDPDNFFGRHADYMMDVLLEESEDEDEERWRLLVLEDTGDLLTHDGAGSAGLSRLLNVVDGIVGQGLRVLVLVTTNEPLKRLHPAVSRPGRCAAGVEFGPFSPDEARAWLAQHGFDGDPPARPTLARLFAHARGDELPDRETTARRVGFLD